MSSRSIRIFETPDQLYSAAAELFVDLARRAIAVRKRFAVALAGGSTPRALYQRLRESPCQERIDWPCLDVFWGDERPVLPHDVASNYRMARESLLDQVPVVSDRVHRMPGEARDLNQAATDYQAEIAAAWNVSAQGAPPAFDLILLGMGDDGHTASLFPRTAALAETARWVVANPVPHLGMTRLTLTLPIINRARAVVFLVVGNNKADVLAEVLEGGKDPRRLPSQAIEPVDGDLCWLIDEAAAGELPVHRIRRKQLRRRRGQSG